MPKQTSSMPILRDATPYPWTRDEHGNLMGANGQAIYFMGADALLVENAPVLLEEIAKIRAKAALSARNPGDVLRSIGRAANQMISNIEQPYLSQGMAQPSSKTRTAKESRPAKAGLRKRR